MRHNPSLREGHQIRLIEGGQAFFDGLVAALQQAQSHVLLETYIFDVHGSAVQVAQALEDAALRGVRVWLVVDGVGTPRLPDIWRNRFINAGVDWQVYSPLGALGLLMPKRWRRLHRKLCVVDGHTAFCGGINILDDWHDLQYGSLAQPRLDFAVIAQGELVGHIQNTMTQLWWRLQGAQQVRDIKIQQAFKSYKKAGLPWAFKNSVLLSKGSTAHSWAALLLRDNVLHRAQIERAYLKAIGLARHDVLIANAYFLPGRRLRQALVHAAGRGVRVRLLLQGRYEYFMQYHAARPVYGTLLAAGVEIYEYDASFLHAKVAVVDAHHERPWATVGSSNLDPISLLLAREANVVVADQQFARQLHQRLSEVIASQSTCLSDAFRQRHWQQRWLDRIAFWLMRLALFLTGHRY